MVLTQTSYLDPYWTVGILIVSGALGGIVSGIYKENNYTLLLPGLKKTKIPLGFIGDILVGITASLVISIVINQLFDKVEYNLKSILLIISVGTLSGFAGIRLIASLSSKLLDQLEKMKTQIDDIKGVNEIEAIVKQGDFLLEADPNRALIMYDNALKKDPANINAMIGKARAIKRQAFTKDKIKGTNFNERIDTAIKQLDDVIKINANCDRAYYIRACYKALSGKSSNEDVLNDLKSAIKISDFYKEYAQIDTELDSIKSDPEFKKITG